MNDGQAETFLRSLNEDGWLQRTVSWRNTLDGSALYTEDGAAVVLDGDVEIFDRELSDANNFDGATLTLQRNTGANAEDVFNGTDLLSALTEGGAVVYSGTTVGTVTVNSGGRLVLTFNGNATNDLLNGLMQRITYANTNDAPPASVLIDWTFDDGNVSTQGSGGPRSVTETMTVNITAVNDAPVIAPVNQIVNGDFAAGLDNWLTTGTVDTNGNALRFGTGGGAGPHTAAQTFTTIPGQVYTLQFDYRDDSVSLNQSLNVSVDGASKRLSQGPLLIPI